MICPACKEAAIVSVTLEEHLSALECKGCGGYWLSAKNYAAWLAQHGETLPEHRYTEVSLDIHDSREAKICPDCGLILLKYKVGHGLDFYVDHCNGCGGIWLDKNEWEALKAKNLHDELNKVFSTSWQQQIREDHLHDKLEQVYIKRFGEDAYQKLVSLREWIHEHPQKAAILAFLADDSPYTL